MNKIQKIKNNNYIFSSNEIKVINFFIKIYKNNIKFNIPTLSNCRYWLSELVQCEYNCSYDALKNAKNDSLMNTFFNYIAKHHNFYPNEYELPLSYINLWNSLDNQEILSTQNNFY